MTNKLICAQQGSLQTCGSLLCVKNIGSAAVCVSKCFELGAYLQASKIERVRDASGSDGGRVDVVDCGPFPTGELDLDIETF